MYLSTRKKSRKTVRNKSARYRAAKKAKNRKRQARIYQKA